MARFMSTPLSPANVICEISKTILQCPVCLIRYETINNLRQPLLLDCHHSACGECLKKLLRHVGPEKITICPVCRAKTKLPENGNLQVNFYILSYLENLQAAHEIPTQSLLKMWCNTCQNVALDDCLSHFVSKLPEALEQQKEKVAETVAYSLGDLHRIERKWNVLDDSKITEDISKLSDAFDCVQKMIEDRIVFLSCVKSMKGGKTQNITRIKTELSNFERKAKDLFLNKFSSTPRRIVGEPFSDQESTILHQLRVLSDILGKSAEISTEISTTVDTAMPSEEISGGSLSLEKSLLDLSLAFSACSANNPTLNFNQY